MHNSERQHLWTNMHTCSHVLWADVTTANQLLKNMSHGGSFKDCCVVSLILIEAEVRRRMFSFCLSATSRGEDFYLISSLHALRLKAGISSHRVKFDLLWYWKGCFGTSAMPVLSQMMRASDVCLRESLCCLVNTPSFSHQSLRLTGMLNCAVIASHHSKWTETYLCHFLTGLLGESSGTAWRLDRQTVAPLFHHGQTAPQLHQSTHQCCQVCGKVLGGSLPGFYFSAL